MFEDTVNIFNKVIIFVEMGQNMFFSSSLERVIIFLPEFSFILVETLRQPLLGF